jgi:hypothetical protein
MSERRPSAKPPWWLWPNLLSLDAPIIAVLWQALFGKMAGARPTPVESIILFLVVWIVYALDRLLDSLRLASGTASPPRHEFAAAHRRAFTTAVVVAAGAGGLMAVRILSPGVLAVGAALAALIGVYFLWNQANRPGWGKNRLKETLIGVFFAAGCALIPMVRGDASAIVFPVLAFGGLCTANCLLIARLERELDRSRGEISGALRLPTRARPARLLALIVALSSVAALVFSMPASRIWAALGLAAGGICLGAVIEQRYGRDAASVWADAALLTPLLFLW